MRSFTPLILLFVMGGCGPSESRTDSKPDATATDAAAPDALRPDLGGDGPAPDPTLDAALVSVDATAQPHDAVADATPRSDAAPLPADAAAAVPDVTVDAAVDAVPPPDCAADTDCAPGEHCEGDECRPGLTLCATPQDCDLDHLCTDTGCVPRVCAVDAACGPNGNCTNGVCCFEWGCVPPPCTTNLDCGLGGLCRDGVCVPPPPCETTDDCSAEQLCVLGACADAPACAEDAECPAVHRCVDARCLRDGACFEDDDCGFEGVVCQAGICVEPVVFCVDDSQCLPTEICHAFIGECRPKDPFCHVAADCGVFGVICVDEMCVVPPPDCVVDADCSPGEVCDAQQCTPVPAGCVHEADCPFRHVCEMATCVPRPAVCASDADCEAGRACSTGQCLAGEPLGDENGYGHDGACDSWNRCFDGRTCADAACESAGFSGAVGWAEGRCDDLVGLTCHLFRRLGEPTTPEDIGSVFVGAGFCNIPVVYDVVCAP